jgi:hypothetical protein
MVAEDRASGKVGTSFWPYGRGFGIQTATDGQIEPDFSLSRLIFPSVISCAASSIRLVPVAVDAIHRDQPQDFHSVHALHAGLVIRQS